MSLRKPDAVTRLLLSLWCLGGLDAPVKQGDVIKAARLGQEKVADYGSIVAELVADGLIVVESVGRSKVFRLLAAGVDRLRAGVLSPEFKFEGAVVGTRFVRPLLKFMREVVAIAPIVVEVVPVEKIEDYEAFKSVALETFDRLVAEYNYNKLVPIYHMRREIGDRVERLQFNEWMTQLHINEVLEFSGCGESRNITQDQLKESIQSPLDSTWFFCKIVG